ncbi:MAG: TonB-dependent receptor, partial [bacterium]
MPRKRSALLLLLAAAILFALHGIASAQTTSGIRGLVLDKDGQPLPSARVTVSNQSIGLMQNAVTDARGEFRIAPLPPAKGYTLKVEFPGMGTIVQSDIEVTASRMTSLPITLRPDTEIREKVRVVAQGEVVNTEQTTTQTSFSSEFIEALPILGRNYQDVLTLAPGVSDVDGDGNPNIHGARDTDIITLVDGVSTTDPFTGQVGQQLNLDSIQEIEVKTAGASAEFSRGQGGFVNIVTKSGGNEFEGSFKFYWRSNIFDGDGAGLDDPTLHGGLGDLGLRDLSFNDYTPFLSMGGPIRRDKAWYYFTAEYIQIEEPVNASTQAFVRGLKEKRVFGKASWDMSTNHKLVFTATIDPQEFFNLGINSLTALEAGFTAKEGGLNLVLKETAIFSPNLFLETTVQHFTSRPERFPTLNPDTNGNGTLFLDRNENGFLEATERDPGEDFDRDGAFDVFEDTNHNGRLDKEEPCRNGGTICGEDRDGDGSLSGLFQGDQKHSFACEGAG